MKPYSKASIINKTFRRKSNHRMLVTVEEMVDVVALPNYIEIINVRYHTSKDNLSCWWEINTFRNE